MNPYRDRALPVLRPIAAAAVTYPQIVNNLRAGHDLYLLAQPFGSTLHLIRQIPAPAPGDPPVANPLCNLTSTRPWQTVGLAVDGRPLCKRCRRRRDRFGAIDLRDDRVTQALADVMQQVEDRDRFDQLVEAVILAELTRSKVEDPPGRVRTLQDVIGRVRLFRQWRGAA